MKSLALDDSIFANQKGDMGRSLIDVWSILHYILGIIASTVNSYFLSFLTNLTDITINAIGIGVVFCLIFAWESYSNSQFKNRRNWEFERKDSIGNAISDIIMWMLGSVTCYFVPIVYRFFIIGILLYVFIWYYQKIMNSPYPQSDFVTQEEMISIQEDYSDKYDVSPESLEMLKTFKPFAKAEPEVVVDKNIISIVGIQSYNEEDFDELEQFCYDVKSKKVKRTKHELYCKF